MKNEIPFIKYLYFIKSTVNISIRMTRVIQKWELINSVKYNIKHKSGKIKQYSFYVRIINIEIFNDNLFFNNNV